MKKKIIWTVSALALMAVIIICGYHWGQANALPGNPDATDELMQGSGQGTESSGEEIVITMPPSDGGEDIIPPGWEDDDTPVSDATQPPKQDDTPVKETTPPATQPPKQNDTPKETEPPKTTQPSQSSGHNCGNIQWIVEQPIAPSCEYPGIIMRLCQCGFYEEVVTAPALGHNFENGKCYRCGQTNSDYVAEEFDYEDIGKAAMKYINQYRAQEGSTQLTWLPGMSQVAQYRSVQLTTNFAHDLIDMREALAYYKYGRYVDATLFGDPPENSYYVADSAEAIGRGVLGTTADAIGKYIADLFHRSSGHWSYVGSSEYSYIGVGYTDGYVCVMVGRVNYG